MIVLKNIADEYYFYSKELLLAFSILFMIITVSGGIYFKIQKENIRYIVNKLIYKFIYSTIITSIGEILCLMGLALEIEDVYFDAVVFILITGSILIYEILLCFMFKQILLPILQSCRYIQITTFLELFLLAFTDHLGLFEWASGTMEIIGIEMLIMLLEKLICIQKKKKEKEKGKEDDYPNPDLYLTRKNQLKKFIEVLKQQEQEPYSIMISGEWGTGKTSFVKRLEKELHTKNFIWVYAGSEKTVSETMSEISNNIVEILKKNNIFLERKDLIKKYFMAFSDLLEGTALEPVKKISSVLFGGKDVNDRDYLNSKLDDLDQTIYLIIDDLDRCDNEYQAKMFKVIRESLELHNCKTIFLVDRAKFLNEKYDANYIEKYVSYTLDLCEVDYQEIVRYLIVDIWDYKFIQRMNNVLLKNRSAEQIREMIYRFPIDLIERLENELTKEKDNFDKKHGNKIEKEKVREIDETIFKIKKDITISRKVKNYLKGIKRDADILNDGIEGISETFLKEDWLRAIIEVQFVKNFMPEIYNDIKMSRNIFEFGQKYTGYVINIILELNYGFLIHNEKKEAILNHIIYKIDVIDYSQVRTTQEKYLSELRSDKAVIKHMGEYITYAETYDDLDKILYTYRTQEFDDSVFRENLMRMIFEVLCEATSSFKPNTKEFLDFSKRMMSCLIKKGLSNKEKLLCVKEGNLIVERTIADNTRLFVNILSIIFDITTVENNWHTLLAADIADINELYYMLRNIDKKSRFKGLDDEINKLLSIKIYFWNLEVELRKEKYKDIGLDLETLFSEIKIVFEICEFWDDIEYVINDSENEENTRLIKQYFVLESGYTFREKAFDDVSNLMEALKALKEFYISKENEYESNYSLLLLRLSYQIILRCEEDPGWFKDEKKQIAKLLVEVTELVCRLDKETDYRAADNITQIKICTYKFNERCKEEAIEDTE